MSETLFRALDRSQLLSQALVSALVEFVLVKVGRLVAAAGCLRLERRLPVRVRRTPKPEAVAQTPLAPPLDLATERL